MELCWEDMVVGGWYGKHNIIVIASVLYLAEEI